MKFPELYISYLIREGFVLDMIRLKKKKNRIVNYYLTMPIFRKFHDVYQLCLKLLQICHECIEDSEKENYSHLPVSTEIVYSLCYTNIFLCRFRITVSNATFSNVLSDCVARQRRYLKQISKGNTLSASLANYMSVK